MTGRVARGRRADQHEPRAGAEQRVRAVAARLARIRQLPRWRTGHSRHRARRERHAVEQLLHLARRPQQRGQHPDRRHERRLLGRRRRRVRLSVRHVQRLGGAGHDRRRPGRSRPRRAGVQHGSEDRRQRLQRQLLRQSRRRVGAGQQHRRRVAQLRLHRPAGADQELGHQLRIQRTDPARPHLVLRQRAHGRHLPGRARTCTAT